MTRGPSKNKVPFWASADGQLWSVLTGPNGAIALPRLLQCLGLLCLLLSGCASYTEETKEIRSAYRADNYDEALKKLDSSSLKEASKNRLLYRLERAMILDRMGEHNKSRALLIEADKVADELYTTSITATAASFIVSESSADYSGEDYEKVAIHTELALSFIGSGDLSAAGVEARKINNKLAELNQKYDEHKNRYADDAFARYLSAIIYEALNEPDSAIIDYKKALDNYRTNFAAFVRGGVPDGLVRAYYRLLVRRNRNDQLSQLEREFAKETQLAKQDLAAPDMGQVVVIHEIGHIATKSAAEFFFPFGKQLIRFSFPVINKTRHDYIGPTGVSDEQSHQTATADNAEDLDAIARFSLEDRKARLILKSGARLIAKGQITEQAYKNFGLLGGLAANVFAFVTETADTRSWTLLPSGFYVSRLRLKPGAHTLRIQTSGRLGKIEKVSIKKGEVLILRDVG